VCQNGIDYRGLELAVKQLVEREINLRKDIEAWADYFLEQGAADIAAGFRNAAEAFENAAENLSKAKQHLEHLQKHEDDHHHSHHITVTQFSE